LQPQPLKLKLKLNRSDRSKLHKKLNRSDRSKLHKKPLRNGSQRLNDFNKSERIEGPNDEPIEPTARLTNFEKKLHEMQQKLKPSVFDMKRQPLKLPSKLRAKVRLPLKSREKPLVFRAMAMESINLPSVKAF
jgi:hypothetical protein